MKRHRQRTKLWGLAFVFVLASLSAACGQAATPETTTAPAETGQPTLQIEPTALPTLPAPTALPTSAPSSPTPVPPSPQPPTPTPMAEPNTWFSGAMALVVNGSYDHADLFALSADGTMWLALPDVGNQAQVSPDGRWLGFVRWSDDGSNALELHDVQTGAAREIASNDASGLLAFAFDLHSRRLAYLDLGSYGEQGVPWALVVQDLESDAVSRYDALMVGPESHPLPGMPIGWSGAAPDELLIDTFLPGTEAGWRGVWGLALPADGASASLDSLSPREIIPGAPTYSSELYFAPQRQTVAFLGRSPDYTPDNYFPEFYDLAVNWLGVASLADGARAVIVEATDGSALARALSWSPDGQRLLFAQGRYEGENFGALSLKSADRSGTVVEYGPLTLPPLGGLLQLAWCDPSQALYVTWSGEDGLEHLVSFNMHTGVSTEISVGHRLEIVGCAP